MYRLQRCQNVHTDLRTSLKLLYYVCQTSSWQYHFVKKHYAYAYICIHIDFPNTHVHVRACAFLFLFFLVYTQT